MRGYQKAPRERFKLLKDKVLTTEELVLYEFLIAITDWDSNHETYGLFKAIDEDIAETLGWKSRSTVCKHRKSLFKKGFLIPVEKGWVKAKDYSEWESRKPSSLVGEKEKVDVDAIASEIEQLDIKELEQKHDKNVSEVEQELLEEIQQEVSKIDQESEEFVQSRGLEQKLSLSSYKGEYSIGNKETEDQAQSDELLEEIFGE